jgi:hypothetical protein
MREVLEARLSELKREYEKGELELQQLQSRLVSLRETMLRISGALTLLEELLASPEATSSQLNAAQDGCSLTDAKDHH